MERLVPKNLTLEFDENVPCLQGHQILWIDVGNNFDCIPNAVEMLKNKSKFPKEENILLHDDLSDDILTKVEEVWPDHRTRKNVKEFKGCECDSVIHVSTGAGISFEVKSYACVLNVFVIFVLFRAVVHSGVTDCVGVAGVDGSDWRLLAIEIVLASNVCLFLGAVVGVFVCFIGRVFGGVAAVGVIIMVVCYFIDVGSAFGACGAIVITVGAVGYVVGCVFGGGVGYFLAGAVDLGDNEEAITRARYFTGIITVNKETGYKKLTEKLR